MIVLKILAIIAAAVGIIGSIVPGLPGPPVSWVGLLLAYLVKGTAASGEPMSLVFLLVWLAVTVAVTVMDYVVPAALTRATGGHKAASWGATIGLFVGMFATPFGMIGCSLLGAFLAELLIENGGAWQSFKASLGAFLGFLCGTGIKLISAGLMAWYIFTYLW